MNKVFFAAINTVFIFAIKLLRYYFMKFRYFPDISYFSKILCLKSFGNLCGNSYVPCLYVIIAHCLTCGERKS